MPEPRIVPYQPRYQPDFYRINAAWISERFGLEEEDKRFLSNPEAEIIAKGGMVFFLLEGDEVADTCGVMKMDLETYELIRMSVDKRFRGKSYGNKLVAHAIDWARAQNAAQVILETSSALSTAIKLYESFGFTHYTPKPEHRSGLARADVFMHYRLAH
jgi:putative acetyltransferase